jgi:hypothetical protein
MYQERCRDSSRPAKWLAPCPTWRAAYRSIRSGFKPLTYQPSAAPQS